MRNIITTSVGDVTTRTSRKSFVSPAGRANKNSSSSSPLDNTVAETPSPGGAFSPDVVQVRALSGDSENSPSKPFDEASPEGKSDVQRKVEAFNRMNNKKGPVNLPGRKLSFHNRYLNQIVNTVSNAVYSSDHAPTQSSSGATRKATGIENEAPTAQKNDSLADEIALAQKLGMAETLASVPESAQRALMMKAVHTPNATDAKKFPGSPSSPTGFMSMPSYCAPEALDAVSPLATPPGSDNYMRPHSLFQSSKKEDNEKGFDKIDHMLAREISDAAADASFEMDLFKSKTTQEKKDREDKPRVFIPQISRKPSDYNPEKEQEDTDLPFDCTVENMNENSQLRYLEEGKNTVNGLKMSVRRIFGVNPSSRKSKKEKREDQTSTLYNATSQDSSDPSRHTIESGSSSERGDESSLRNKEKRRKIRMVMYIWLIVLLVIVGILASLVAGGKISFWSDEASKNAISDTSDEDSIFETVTSTSEATFTPTQLDIESNLFEGSELVACANAIPLTEMDQAYYGSNWKAFWDTSIDTCGDQMATGYAVWYSFTTNSTKLVEVSTCNNADFDTQITVMSGECGETTCVSYNDQACGDQSLVTWYAEADTTYYIMVHGFREASGTFGLTLSEAIHNDNCDSAKKLQDETMVSGTTAGAMSVSKPPECGDVDFSGEGVWYEVSDISGFYKAELLRGYTNFSGQVAVYRSIGSTDMGCGTLVCDKGSSTGSVMWLAEATETYYIYVTGTNGIAGDFDLFIGRNKDASCQFGTRVDSNSVGFLASTEFENPQNVESCGYTGYHTAPGLWFSVMGTGTMLEVSTCGSLNDLDTQISVFGNTCDSLECIGGTGQDIPCGDNGSVFWKTEKNEVYNIYVSGRSSRVGDFVLNINEVPELDGSKCDGSLPLDLGSTTIQSNTTNALSESVDLCTGPRAVRGSWHKFIGTGKTSKISVCNNQTDFDARISLFTGSCDGLSCVAFTWNNCGENDEILVTTHVGVTYYIFVHGPDSVTIGNYLLTIEDVAINDSCEMASSVELASSSQYFGSTLSANNSTATECTGEITSPSPALWYTFVGSGDVVTLSTCSPQTDFNTNIRVFSGSCSQFGCVSDTTITSCDDQSIISFQSVADEVYYVRIGGTLPADAGNFVLELNPRSRFFGPSILGP